MLVSNCSVVEELNESKLFEDLVKRSWILLIPPHLGGSFNSDSPSRTSLINLSKEHSVSPNPSKH